eukprot:8165987-Lingulodinium_polyedra.AAC.1
MGKAGSGSPGASGAVPFCPIAAGLRNGWRLVRSGGAPLFPHRAGLPKRMSVRLLRGLGLTPSPAAE